MRRGQIPRLRVVTRSRISPEAPLSSSLGYVLRLALFALVLSLGACARKPTMKLNHAEISGVQLGFPPQLGVVMTCVVDVTNPNAYDVAVRSVRGTVTLGKTATLPIDFHPDGEGVWLATDRVTPVRIPVVVPVAIALNAIAEAYTSPVVTFHVAGRADVTATRTLKIEKDNYVVDEDGTISRSEIESAIRGLGFPGATPPP